MMKRAVALLALTLCSGTAAAEAPVAEVSQLRLYSSFWQNLHHFLYVSAWGERSRFVQSDDLGAACVVM
jgi:hypothetical protein